MQKLYQRLITIILLALLGLASVLVIQFVIDAALLSYLKIF